jgi:hypothetical protein
MKPLILTIAILCVSAVNLYAQFDFRPGYVVTTENDTIRGLIDYKGNKANAKKCVFKPTADSKSQEFSPEQIRAYRFTDSKFFISKTLEIYGEENTLFLEYLINGIVDLFYYRDNAGEHYWVELENGDLRELRNDEREVYINDTKYRKESKEYIGILKLVFSKSPSVAKKTESVRLDHQSLIDIAHTYHNEVCTGETCIVYEKKMPLVKFKFGLALRANAMALTRSSNLPVEYDYLNNSNFNNPVTPSLGFFLKLNIPALNERLFFQYMASIGKIDMHTVNIHTEKLYSMTHRNEIWLNQTTFFNSGTFRYEFPKGILTPVVQLGGFVNSFSNVDYTHNMLVRYSWGDVYDESVGHVSPFSKFDYGVQMGLGVKGKLFKNKELTADLNYLHGFGYLYGLNTNTVTLDIGIQLGGR